MMKAKNICLLLLIGAFLTQEALSQARDIFFTGGPQISTLGVGVTGGVHLQEVFSLSVDLNFLPLSDRVEEIDGIDYELDPQVGGTVIMANFHPGGKGFSVGIGAMFGGYNLDGVSTDVGSSISIGDETYPSSAVGTLTGSFEVGGPSVALHLGWRGDGFNFGLGVFSYNRSASLDASGPVGNDPEFRANVDQEIDNILEELDVVPVIPYLRIGYQFGF